MLSSPRNSVTHNQQAKLATDLNELLKELSSHEITTVGCYTIGETIGQGTYGKVKKGTHKLTGKVVAIKKISKEYAPILAREIHHHRQLKHPNIVMLYEMITTESAIHIISEYCSSGDLLDALAEEPTGRCSESKVRKWCQQLTDALKYCHTRGIVHRDLKLENVLLDSNDNAKICDFGFARFAQKNQFLETFCGSLSYSAPEVILRKKYTGPECDVWSLGVIIFTLLAGEYPFDDDSEVVTQRKIVAVDYEMPFYFSSHLSDLISNMLQLEPSNRLTVDAILEHPWTAATIQADYNDEEHPEGVETQSDESSIEEETCITPSSSTTTAHPLLSTDITSLLSRADIHTDTLISDQIKNDASNLNDNASSGPFIKFSPHVRSSLGMALRPSNKQQQPKSPRFSAPTALTSSLPVSSPLHNDHYQHQSTPFRTSLPSSFLNTANISHQYDTITSHTLPNMTSAEQRLFAALTAAGFDRTALIKMQSGQCDTSSTLWHILLENMINNPSTVTERKTQSVPDAFVSALQSRNQKMMLSMPASNPSKASSPMNTAFMANSTNNSYDKVEKTRLGVDRAIQTDFDDKGLRKDSLVMVNTQSENSIMTLDGNTGGFVKKPRSAAAAMTTSYVQPYPRPPLTSQQKIETVGFGSPIIPKQNHPPAAQEKPTWLSSVKSWFGAASLSPLANNDTTIHVQQRHRSHSNCSTISSPIATPSSYRNFDTTVQTNDASTIISSPIYRNGGSLSSQQQQKYRRRALQLSAPPTSELDKLAFMGLGSSIASKSNKRLSRRRSSNGGTSSRRSLSNTTSNSATSSAVNTIAYQHYLSNINSVDSILTVPRPTIALASPSTKDAHFSILTKTAEVKEVDMLTAKRYPSTSILHEYSSGLTHNRDNSYGSSSSSSSSSGSSDVEAPVNEEHRLSILEPTGNNTASQNAPTSFSAQPIADQTDIAAHCLNKQTGNNSLTPPCPSESPAKQSVDEQTAPTKIDEEAVKKTPPTIQSRLTEVLEVKRTSARRPIKPLSLSEQATSAGHPSPSLSSPTTSVYSPQSSRFEFAPRSRLSVYGMHESRSTPMVSKVIVEEEEEEEEEEN